MPRVTNAVADLDQLSPAELGAMWEARFGAPPPALTPCLLALGIAYDLQVNRHGGLDRRLAKRLDRIADALETKAATAPSASAGMVAGTRLVRDWGGQRHHVELLDGGRCRHDGRDFGSLSEVARHITGARWSGPRFFGVQP